MAMNKVPTLILGLGGIGCQIAAEISDKLSDEDRKYVGVVGMDTNVNDLKKLKEHGVKSIQTSDQRLVKEYLELHPEYIKWFPINKFTVRNGKWSRTDSCNFPSGRTCNAGTRRLSGIR